MTVSCGNPNCHSTSADLMNCKKCKAVAYCSVACQKEDWPEHKELCKRKEFEGAPCDGCDDTENDIVTVCRECGFLICLDCHEKIAIRDAVEGEKIISLGSCPGCQKPRRITVDQQYEKKLEKLIKENKGDPRVPRWLVHLGLLHKNCNNGNGNQKAKNCFLRAGELGLGEGYGLLADIYTVLDDWDEARRYYQMAAARMYVTAIYMLGIEAKDGYFHFEDGRESPKRQPDLKKAFRLFREGASLGHAGSCKALGCCFFMGLGTQQNAEKSFKWFKKAAEKGDSGGMIYLGQHYHHGTGGVEKSNVQAKYWLEKALHASSKWEEHQNHAMAREMLGKLDAASSM